MKKITLLFLFFITKSFAQYIVNTTYIDGGDHFVYNGNLLFSGNVGGISPVFAKYDGVTATAIENPSGFTNVYTDYPISYNGEFYFKASPGNFLGRYNGTTVSYIDKVNPADIGLASAPIIYNAKLSYIYRNALGLRQLATYDGTIQTIYPNPDASSSAYSYVFSEYNGEQYFGYVNANGNIALVKFDGTNVSLISNPNSADWGIYSGNSCVVNNKLIFLYQTSDAKVHFASYDGSSITVMPNLAATDDFIYSNLIEFNGAVYARYKDVAGKFHIAKYDGTTMTVLPNLNTTDVGYMDSPFVYNNNLYFRYINAASPNWLARTDGVNVELLAQKYLGGFGNPKGYALEVAGNIYFKTETPSLFTTLAKYDGTNFTTYVNASNTDPVVGSNELVFFNNKIHFVADGKLSYIDEVILDTKSFDKNEFKLYPNPSNGEFTIQTTIEMIGANATVFNLMGQKIKSFELGGIETKQNLNSGFYIISFEKDGKKTTQKISIK